jgi:integrin alpha FG-GAP repeat containing protein 1
VLAGVSFFWVNSVGDAIRVAYAPQMWQTAYSALQVPYAYCGLGRANNYVESFTVGMLGQSHKWSPIIPNSQLVTYLKGSDAK